MAPSRKAQRAGVGAGKEPRRAAGALESAVLAVLWEGGEPLSPSEVRERLAAQAEAGSDELAYTTVVTILTRLVEKDALARERDGRVYRYAPVADAAGLAARRLTALLDSVADRDAVLSRFVEDLPDGDEQLLRDLLGARIQHPAPGAE